MKKTVCLILTFMIIITSCFGSCAVSSGEDAFNEVKAGLSGKVPDFREASVSAGSFSDIEPGKNYSVTSDIIIGEEYNGQNIDMKGTTLSGNGNIIINAAGIELYNLALDGVKLTAGKSSSKVVIKDCNISADFNDMSVNGTAVYNSVIKGNVVLTTGSVAEHCEITGKTMAENCMDVLISVSKINGDIAINGSRNCVILKNEFASDNNPVDMADCSYITVAENIFGGSEDPITAGGVTSLLVNGNKDYSGNVITESGENDGIYGNDIAAVGTNAAGCDESLLPQVENDRFDGMISTGFKNSGNTDDVKNYFLDIKDGGTVIIPPGIYDINADDNKGINISGLKNVKIYAYGVLFVFEDPRTGAFVYESCENVKVYGLTMDFARIPNTQGTVIKSTVEYVIWKADEGYPSDIYDTEWYAEDCQAEGFRKGTDYAFTDLSVTYKEKQEDGTVKLYGSNLYDLNEGDKIILRGVFAHVNLFKKCKDMLYEDITIYSGSGFGICDSLSDGGMVYNRIKITPGPVPNGGTEERMISVCDATHLTAGRGGPVVTNCYFEKMTDDGTNINGMFADYISYDKGNKTLYYNEDYAVGFKKGDEIAVLTEDGQLLQKTYAAADSKTGSVKVKDGTKINGSKLIIENRSANSQDFIFKNILIQKIRSRGILIKARGEVSNCTVRLCGMAGILVSPEVADGWGESCYAEDLIIKNNLFEKTGLFYNRISKDFYSPISIAGSKTEPEYPDMLAHRNITIESNVVNDRFTPQAVYAEGVYDLNIKNNDFGIRIGVDPELPLPLNTLYGDGDDTVCPVKLSGCCNVDLDGNVYPNSITEKYIELTASVNVTVN